MNDLRPFLDLRKIASHSYSQKCLASFLSLITGADMDLSHSPCVSAISLEAVRLASVPLEHLTAVGWTR